MQTKDIPFRTPTLKKNAPLCNKDVQYQCADIGSRASVLDSVLVVCSLVPSAAAQVGVWGHHAGSGLRPSSGHLGMWHSFVSPVPGRG